MILLEDARNQEAFDVLTKYATSDDVSLDKIFRLAVGVYQLYREGKLQFREELGGGCYGEE